MVFVPISILFSCFCCAFCLFARVFVPLVTPLTRLARPRSESVPGSFLKFSQKKVITVQPEGLHVPAEPYHRFSRMGIQPGAVSSGFDSVVIKTHRSAIKTLCNSRLLRSHMRLKKNRPYNLWLKSQGHYLLCCSTSRTVGANSVRLRHETRTRYSLKATTKISPHSRKKERSHT